MLTLRPSPVRADGCAARPRQQTAVSAMAGAGRLLAGADARAVVIVRQDQDQGLVCQELAERLTSLAVAKAGGRVIVALAGMPGSGKSTMATEVVKRVNAGRPPIALAVGMDGFHFSKAQLAKFPDPVEAMRRRGAHWTFDAAGFVAAVTSLRESDAVSWPGFEHGVGDPVPGAVQVRPHHRVVLVEGNYLLLDEVAPWGELRQVCDERWYISIPLDAAMERVYARHVSTGKTAAMALERVTTNDRLNGQLVENTAHRADVIAPSYPTEMGDATPRRTVAINLFWPIAAGIAWTAWKFFGV